jgi:uncharacterized protein YcfL
MKFWPIILVVFLLAACSSTPEIQIEPTNVVPALPAELPNLGEAPELTNEVWLNTDYPLRLANLRGKVVLLDMWTFG